MFGLPSGITDHLRELIAAGTVAVTLVAGYTGMQKDIHSIKAEVQSSQQINEKQQALIHEDQLTTARVDERTRIMKEQLDRIERHVTRGQQ